MAGPNGSPILDDFTRADQDPITGNWTTPGQSGNNNMRLVSNQMAGPSSGGSADAYWNPGTFAASSGVLIEAFMDLAIVSGTSNRFFLSICIQNPNSGSYNSYGIQINRATSIWRLNRVDATISSNIHADVTQAVSSGDGAAISLDGTGLITVWYRAGAGSWTSLFTQTDTTYTSGYIGAGMLDVSTNERIDNFGGGQVVTSDPLTGCFMMS